MAKKRLNLRSTMNKNQDTELPQKVALKKTSKDLDEVKEKVDAIHETETSTLKTAPKRNTRKAKTKLTTDKDEIVRITIDLPKSLHKKLKIHAVINEVTIRNYVVNLLEKSLK